MEKSAASKRRRIRKNDRFEMKQISPIGERQSAIFKAFDENFHLLIHGVPGTGKTFISMGLALDEILYGGGPYKKLYIVRSLVQSRDMGFLPGNQKEKAEAYESAYMAITTELFEREDAYDILKNRNLLEFKPTSFLRGLNFRDCIVMVDECQNMNDMELHTIITRATDTCRLIFLGDNQQDDLTNERKREKSGFPEFMTLIKKMKSIKSFEMTIDDIQRGGLVREYILTKLAHHIPVLR